MSINAIYSKLFAGDVVLLETDKNTYQTIRTSLLRLYRASSRAADDRSMEANYIQASYNKDSGIASFAIKPIHEKKKKQLNYTLL